MEDAKPATPRSAAELLAEIERIRAEVLALQTTPPQRTGEPPEGSGSTTRREAFRLASAATAAAVVGTVVTARPAAAADPNDVVKNVDNPVIARTTLSGSFNTELLRLTNTGADGRGLLAISQGEDISAVRGDNSNSTGPGGVGVGGNAPGGRDILAFGSGRIGMNSHNFSLVSNQYTTGEIHQINGTLYGMVSPTTRRSIVGPNAAGALYPINPARVYDSRRPAPDPGTVTSGTNRVVSVADARDLTTGAVTTANVVPVGATAIVFNLTVTGTVGGGFLAITSGSAGSYSASIINWSSGWTVANASTVPVNASRQVKIWCGGGTTHVILDVMGYYL